MPTSNRAVCVLLVAVLAVPALPASSGQLGELPAPNLPPLLNKDGSLYAPPASSHPSTVPPWTPGPPLDGAIGCQIMPSPPAQDCDGDGLDLAAEALASTNPEDWDSDNDKLSDRAEVLAGTDPNRRDTDSDGMPDYVEVAWGTDPLSASDGTGDLDGDSFDRNLDGTFEVFWTGADEYKFHMPVGWDDATSGPWMFGSNPNSADTDADLYADGMEVFYAADPTVTTYEPRGLIANTDPLADDGTVYTLHIEDNDGLLLFQEYVRGTGMWTLDSDGDGLCDGLGTPACAKLGPVGELELGTSPTASDTDGDGLSDLTEFNMWVGVGDVDHDRAPGPLDSDSDSDGLSDGNEVTLGVRPEVFDTDGDGLGDGQEVNSGWDPLDQDSDQDFLSDGIEFQEALLVGDPDSDHDGMLDGIEFGVAGTNPRQKDTDVDGLPDLYEFQHALQATQYDSQLDLDGDGLPNILEYHLGTLPETLDTSADGMPDGWEYAYGFDPAVAKAASVDSDGDGLTDVAEFSALTNPLLPDTDDDGLSDNQEMAVYGTNPLIFDSDNDGLWDGPEVALWASVSPDAWKTPYAGLPRTCAFVVCLPRLTPANNLLVSDADADGLSDYDEFVVIRTDPSSSQSFPLRPSSQCASPIQERQILTDLVYATRFSGWQQVLHDDGRAPLLASPTGTAGGPCNDADADGDGFADWDEATYGTDPQNMDSDCDGLTDYLEFRHWGPSWNVGGNRMLNWDVDGDTISDGQELGLLGTTAWPFHTNPANSDTDGDGVPDGQEFPHRVDGVANLDNCLILGGGSAARSSSSSTVPAIFSSPILRDTDFDGVDDLTEELEGLNPALCDSDSDLLGDGLEMGLGVHPGPLPWSNDNPCTHYDSDPLNDPTDPLLPNTDLDLCDSLLGDGVEDQLHNGMLELDLEGNPARKNTDLDAIEDCDEYVALNGVAPFEPESIMKCLSRTNCDGDQSPDSLPDDADGLQGSGFQKVGMLHSYEYNWWTDGDDSDGKDRPGLGGFMDPDQDDDGLEDSEEHESLNEWANADHDTMVFDGNVVGRQNIFDSDSDDDGIPDLYEKRGASVNSMGALQTRNMEIADEDADGILDGLDIDSNLNAATDGEILNIDYGLAYLADEGDVTASWDTQTPYIDLIGLYASESEEATPLVEITGDALKAATKKDTNRDGKVADLLPDTTPVNFWDFPGDPKHLPNDITNYVDANPQMVNPTSGTLCLWLRVRFMEEDDITDDVLDINGRADKEDAAEAFDRICVGGADLESTGASKAFDYNGWNDGLGCPASNPGDPDCGDAELKSTVAVVIDAELLHQVLMKSCSVSKTDATCQGPGAV